MSLEFKVRSLRFRTEVTPVATCQALAFRDKPNMLRLLQHTDFNRKNMVLLILLTEFKRNSYPHFDASCLSQRIYSPLLSVCVPYQAAQ